ncbi:MAG TPA: hypothetical protein VF188_16980 [Longimicrobiales bacterium]
MASERRNAVAMKRWQLAALALLLSLITGCELVKGIFKVGFWAGVILIVLIILVIWLLTRLFR